MELVLTGGECAWEQALATNKNQHFVPRCYLRRFAADTAGKSINLYNIDRDLFVRAAAVKNQCSRDYFYGTDAQLEGAIQAIEQEYGRLAGCIHQPEYRLNDDDRATLKLFWLLQHLRTEAASKRTVDSTNAIVAVSGQGGESYRTEVRDAVLMLMELVAECMEVVSDLKVCIVRNRTRVPFVSSDDPAVLSNRWHLLNSVRAAHGFGLVSAGALLVLPISPEVLFLGYDGDVYSCTHRDGWVDIRKDADAAAFNQHQYLNSCANIFVRDSEHFDATRDAFLTIAGRRPKQRHHIRYAVSNNSDSDSETLRFAVVDRQYAVPGERGLVHCQDVHAVPTAWPSVLRWRPGGCYFSNGSAVGFVRRAFTQKSDGKSSFKKRRALL